MRRSPETTLANSYFTLVAADFHNRMEDVGDAPYTVVGGLGLHAVTHAEEIDWDDRVVRIGNIYLPRRRENNGTGARSRHISAYNRYSSSISR